MAAGRQRRAARLRPALLCALAAVVPRLTVAQYCPYMRNPIEVYGVEDVPLPMQQAWINSPSTAAEHRSIAGRLWHGHCPSTVCGSCLGEETPQDGREKSKDHIQVTYSVLYGRLFLAQGYLSCNPLIDASNFDVVSEREEKSFSMTDDYAVVNCTLQYLTFQGLRYFNKMKQLNQFGIQPRVRVQVGPPRLGGPVKDGLDYIYSIETNTFVVLDEMNTLPNLEACPTMGIEKESDAVRYREQYDSAVIASAVRPQLLYWDPSSGGNRCLQTRLPGADRLLFPAPQPNGYQPPQMNAGQLIGLHTPVKGSPVAPKKIEPTFCQTQDERILDPPFCASLAAYGHVSCAADPMSYVYHIEDYEDAVLKINGVRLWDKDIWTGHLDTTFSFKFKTMDGGDGVSKANDPFDNQVDDGGLNIQDGSGNFVFFCARPYYDSAKRATQFETGVNSNNQAWNKHCARTLQDAISGIVMLDKQQTKFYVLPSVDRTVQTMFEETNCRMTECVVADGCNPSAENQKPENKWMCSRITNLAPGSTECKWGFGNNKDICARVDGRCICKSKVYERTVHKGQDAWSMVLFWELADRENRTKVFETGYLDITYTNSSVVDGTMWADPQTLEYYTDYSAGTGDPFDWFRVSPMKLQGKLSTSVDVTTYTLDASTKNILNPRFKMTLQSQYGNISLPNLQNLNLMSTPEQSRTRIHFEGTIDQVNEALNVIEYRVPGYLYPHFHTLSERHSIYGHVEEKLTLTLDDLGNSGTPSRWGTATSMEFNLVVSANSSLQSASSCVCPLPWCNTTR